MFFKKKHNQPTIRLKKVGKQYFIEHTIPVEIEQDNVTCGIRIISLISNSGHKHDFKVNRRYTYKSINRPNGITGIILRKFH